MKIWVTGAGGFIGRNLVAQLVANNHVVGIYRHEPESLSTAGAEVRLLDLSDFKSVCDALEADRPDQIYHLAGTMPPAESSEMWLSLVRNNYHLLNAVRTLPDYSPRILVSGSAAEYLGNDSGVFSESSAIGGYSDYGMAKSAQSRSAFTFAEADGLDVIVARCFNILGPAMSEALVVGSICAQLKSGATELRLGNLTSERDFLDVRDVADAFRFIMAVETRLPVVNVCSGKATKISDLVDTICDVFAVTPEIISNSVPRQYDIDRAIGDATLLSELGWQPTISLRQSIADIRDYDPSHVANDDPGHAPN